jgi:hypothetical protein
MVFSALILINKLTAGIMLPLLHQSIKMLLTVPHTFQRISLQINLEAKIAQEIDALLISVVFLLKFQLTRLMNAINKVNSSSKFLVLSQILQLNIEIEFKLWV